MNPDPESPYMRARRLARQALVAGTFLGAAACGNDASSGPQLVGTPVVIPTVDPSFVADPAIRPPTPTPVPPTAVPTREPEGPATTTPVPTTEPPATPTLIPTTPATPTPPVVAGPTATMEPTATPVATEAGAPIYLRPAAPNGRQAPQPPQSAAEVAAGLIHTDQILQDPATSRQQQAEMGHAQQVLYRVLGRQPDWDQAVLANMPADLATRVQFHIAARRAISGLSSGFPSADFIPAWEIVAPAPADDLLRFYQDAESQTGIDWEYLAAINLMETGLGRIQGLSSAGAQGPMQFMPFTWEEIGEGDVTDPADSILAAGRYLVRRGGPDDMAGALWGYNNSDHYVDAVTAYADLLRHDSGAFTSLYHWEIYFSTDQGDVWLPVGTRTDRIDLDEFLAAAPWSRPAG